MARRKKVPSDTTQNFSGMKINPWVKGHKTRKAKRKAERRNEGHYNHTKTNTRFPKPRYRNRREYDFLQYIRIVFKWATEKYELTRPEIELILYLYPKGTFTKRQLTDYQKTISMYQLKTFKSLLAEGWIKLWRPRRGNESALYTLTDRAKRMCSRMHKICTGEEDIPTSSRSNPLAKDDSKRINKYYMDVIKQMNKDRGK